MDRSKENTNEIAVKVDGVSKVFKLPHEKHSTVKSIFVNIFKKKKYEKQHALKNVSFEINKGEFFGIVGRNGSGKSTLLKMIAGIYNPTHGTIKVNGSLTPFIELGVGFNPELTGRENVFLNGALLGFNRKEMTALYDEIVEFAELEKFMDQKLKNYSSGMQVRLAFSIAIRAQSDILLLDEVLAVGDAAFQTKCFDYFQQLKERGTTVIFISHDKTSLERFCERGILLNNGSIVEAGPMNHLLDSYSRIVLDELERSEMSEQEKTGAKGRGISNGSRFAKITKTSTYNEKNKLQKKFVPGEAIQVRFLVKASKELINPILGVTIWQKNVEKPIFANNTLIDGNTKTGIYPAGSQISFTIKIPNTLNDGEYFIEPAIANESASVFYDQVPRAHTFYINGGKNPYSIVFADQHIHLEVEQ